MMRHFNIGWGNSKKKPAPSLRQFHMEDLPPLRCLDGHPTTIRFIKEGQCRWPYGNPRADMVMCGREIEHGAYCAEHHQMAKAKRV